MPLRQSVVLLSLTLLLLPAGFGSGFYSDFHWRRFAAHQRVDCQKVLVAMNSAAATMAGSTVQKRAKMATKKVATVVIAKECLAQKR